MDNKKIGHMDKHKIGFTLAEVLITLGIIGVVAAWTIPVLVARYQEKVIVTKLKKTYSILSQALETAQVDNGPVESWAPPAASATELVAYNKTVYEILKPYFKVVKDCEQSAKGCFSAEKIKGLNGQLMTYSYGDGSMHNGVYTFILSDGISVLTGGMYDGNPYTVGLYFYVDIDGPKGANTWGKDLFAFMIKSDDGKLIPNGLHKPEETKMACYDSGEGHNCAAWVLYNENTDYLRCTDLSWNGKTKCD